MEHDMYPVFVHYARSHGLEAARNRFTALGLEVVDAMVSQYSADLERIAAGGPPVIAPAGREAWYGGPSEDDVHWPSLKHHLKETHGWPEGRVESLDRASTKVVAHAPPPNGRRRRCKGLVVGYVQSGKTTNFTSVIAKSADVEYRLVIVLSGIHNGLRKQTQQRLDEYLEERNPTKWLTLTDEARDFHIPTQSVAALLSGHEPKVVIAVVKKNAVVLRRLIKWLRAPGASGVLRQRWALVIDDEADQASVATKTINPRIRDILSLLPNHTYIGYTATPFANVFVDPAAGDLYPEDFILNLPEPEGYFGPSVLFGRPGDEDIDDPGADGHDMIRVVPDEDVPLLRPVGRGNADFAPTQTVSLQDSVRWFWLATAARRARGDHGHSTMLIHTHVKTAVHYAFVPLLERVQQEALAELARGDFEEWRRQWESETARVPASHWGRSQNSFEDLVPRLAAAVADTKIIVDNSTSEYRLNYDDDAPTTAIAVGGNTLSRGLTLEGLVSSLFVRGASTYDTLLQMGRWFGFRHGYEDLPRIWMTEGLESDFRHLAQVEHEMRMDIDSYQQQDKTPLDIAVRIKTHPALAVTAKMGAAVPAEVSYAGRRLQTRYFRHKDRDWLESNIHAAEQLVRVAGSRGQRDGDASHLLFRDVPAEHVRNFLREYSFHEDSADLNSDMLVSYLDKQLALGNSVDLWSVAVVEGELQTLSLAGHDVPAARRSRLPDGSPDRADIKTLMSKQDLVLDLPIPVAEAKRKTESDLKTARALDPVASKRGLLALYVIDPKSEPTPGRRATREPLDAAAPVIGVGLMFPGDAVKGTGVRYVAVDLSAVEAEDPEDLEAALNTDSEDPQ